MKTRDGKGIIYSVLLQAVENERFQCDADEGMIANSIFSSLLDGTRIQPGDTAQ